MAPDDSVAGATGRTGPAGWQGQLVSCEVLPGELGNLYRVYAATVNARVAERCRSVLGQLDAAGVAEQLASIEPLVTASRWTGPRLAFACHEGLAARDGSAAHVASLVAQLAGTLREPPPLTFALEDHDYPWARYAIGVFEGDVRRDGKEPDHLVLVDAMDADAHGVTAALRLLRGSWPEMAELVDLLVRHIVWFGRPAGGVPGTGTSIKTFGALFLAAGYDALALLEGIVHEATHLDMIMRQSADRLIVNREQTGKSPVREQTRPLMRVLHAAVVAARSSMAYRRCSSAVSADLQARCHEGALRAERILREGLAGLAGAQWTPAGEKLAAALHAYSQQTSVPSLSSTVRPVN